jgi:hypothetical protein
MSKTELAVRVRTAGRAHHWSSLGCGASLSAAQCNSLTVSALWQANKPGSSGNRYVMLICLQNSSKWALFRDLWCSSIKRVFRFTTRLWPCLLRLNEFFSLLSKNEKEAFKIKSLSVSVSPALTFEATGGFEWNFAWRSCHWRDIGTIICNPVS